MKLMQFIEADWLHEKVANIQQGREFLVIYGTRSFIPVFVRKKLTQISEIKWRKKITWSQKRKEKNTFVSVLVKQ
jgi:hypothetical protein